MEVRNKLVDLDWLKWNFPCTKPRPAPAWSNSVFSER